jgi:hypothetical protein
VPLICIPQCVHGICVEPTGTSGAGGTVCECNGNWTGPGCDQSVFQPPEVSVETPPGIDVGLVIGVVVGVFAVIVILVVIVIVLIAKRPKKRGGRNFVPLDKKDFTKIIWGDQLNAPSEKTTAKIKELEELMTEDNLEVAFAVSNMTQITDADKVAKAMIVLFQDNGKVLHLLEAFIAEEIQQELCSGVTAW